MRWSTPRPIAGGSQPVAAVVILEMLHVEDTLSSSVIYHLFTLPAPATDRPSSAGRARRHPRQRPPPPFGRSGRASKHPVSSQHKRSRMESEGQERDVNTARRQSVRPLRWLWEAREAPRAAKRLCAKTPETLD